MTTCVICGRKTPTIILPNGGRVCKRRACGDILTRVESFWQNFLILLPNMPELSGGLTPALFKRHVPHSHPDIQAVEHIVIKTPNGLHALYEEGREEQWQRVKSGRG